MTDEQRALAILEQLKGLTTGQQLTILAKLTANVIVMNATGPLSALDVSGQVESALYKFTRDAAGMRWPAPTKQ